MSTVSYKSIARLTLTSSIVELLGGITDTRAIDHGIRVYAASTCSRRGTGNTSFRTKGA